eukprot:TRINITY_DN10878_c0_g1_i14.p7 TRINITY_DN10878_c0_g1~~TRINITY_DN10878_c0_g1_i14.p7  ORF type:complete len:103 (+),score=16.58 TRINITY_DN10878_c0_g1_i14:2014-2322(+)
MLAAHNAQKQPAVKTRQRRRWGWQKGCDVKAVEPSLNLLVEGRVGVCRCNCKVVADATSRCFVLMGYRDIVELMLEGVEKEAAVCMKPAKDLMKSLFPRMRA